MIFQQKYAPTSFGDLIFPDTQTRQRLEEFGKNKRHGSLIFHGPYGTAKTTTAKILVKMRSPDNAEGDFYRASQITEKSFDGINNSHTFQKFCGVEIPVSIVDEIDQVDTKLQHMLRAHIDTYAGNGGFIFTTNNLHKVDPGLVDRCDVVELPAANTQHWFARARWILDQEGVQMSDAKLQALLKTCDGSIRDLMRALEDAVVRKPRNNPPPQLQVISPKQP